MAQNNSINNNDNNEDNYLMIKEYEKKIIYLEKSFELLVQLNNKKNLEREKNKIKIKNELDKAYKEIQFDIETHKSKMINKIDECFSQIQNVFIYMIQNKKTIHAQQSF